MRQQVQDHFEEQGLTPADWPKAFVVHEMISVGFLLFTWAACYYMQPTQSTIFKPVAQAIQESNNGLVVNMRKGYVGAIQAAQEKIGGSWLANKDTPRLTASLVESTAIRKVLKPLTIPGKFWTTYKVVQGLKGGRDPRSPSQRGKTAFDSPQSSTEHSRRRGGWGGTKANRAARGNMCPVGKPNC